jgi:hypothetical protein
MDWDAQSVISVITALSSFATVVGGTWIAIKQAGIGKKVDEAKVAATDVAVKLTENATVRAQQMEEVKKTVVDKVEEVKQAVKGNGR